MYVDIRTNHVKSEEDHVRRQKYPPQSKVPSCDIGFQCSLGTPQATSKSPWNRCVSCFHAKTKTRWKKWWCYGEMDTTVGFSASNRSIYILKREAHNSWRMCYGGGFVNRENRKNGKRFCLLWKNWWCYGETDTTV